jgi:hypothetical protein
MQATLVLIAAVGSDTNNYQHECTLLDDNQFISYSFLHFNLGLSKAFLIRLVLVWQASIGETMLCFWLNSLFVAL